MRELVRMTTGAGTASNAGDAYQGLIVAHAVLGRPAQALDAFARASAAYRAAVRPTQGWWACGQALAALLRYRAESLREFTQITSALPRAFAPPNCVIATMCAAPARRRVVPSGRPTATRASEKGARQ